MEPTKTHDDLTKSSSDELSLLPPLNGGARGLFSLVIGAIFLVTSKYSSDSSISKFLVLIFVSEFNSSKFLASCYFNVCLETGQFSALFHGF